MYTQLELAKDGRMLCTCPARRVSIPRLCLCCLVYSCQAFSLQSPQNLRVEYLEAPLGIDVPRPRFQWNYEATPLEPRALVQKAYQVNVSKVDAVTRNLTSVWDSGQVMSNATSQIHYDGHPLESDSDYVWSVRWWNDTSLPPSEFTQASFSTSIMNESEWIANWVGRPLHRVSNHLDQKNVSDSARFRTEFPLPDNVSIVRARAYAAGLGYYKLFINGRMASSHNLGPLTFYPVRVLYDSVNVLSYLVSGKNAIGLRVGPGFWSLDYKGKLWALVQIHITLQNGSMLLVTTHGGQSSWLPMTTVSKPLQVLPTTWRVHDDPCIKVDIYQGETYDARMDTPLWNTVGFDDSLWEKVYSPSLVQCAFIEENNNALIGCSDPEQEIASVQFASYGQPSGMCRSAGDDQTKSTFYVNDLCNAANTSAIIKQLCLGRHQCIVPATNILFGDPCQKADKLLAVSVSCDERGSRLLQESVPGHHPLTDNEIHTLRSLISNFIPDVGKRQSNLIPPITDVEYLRPARVYEVKDGVFVMDLGRNIAGTCEVFVKGMRGDTITLIKGEELFPNGSVHNQLTINMIGTFILNGTEGEEGEHLPSSWIYYGFQYVEIHGLPPSADPYKAVICKAMHTNLESAGMLTFGSPENDEEEYYLNKIQTAIVQTQVNNVFSIPTGCANREKRGWMGDAQVTALEAIWNLDMAAFYSNWIQTMEDVQLYNAAHYHTRGAVPDIVPIPTAPLTTDAAWSSAYILISWYVYQHYGDVSLLGRHYEGYKMYVDYLTSIADNKTGLLLFHKYGDWSNTYPRSYEIPTTGPISACFHYILDLQLLSSFAALLGNTEDAQRYAEMHTKLIQPFHDHFYNSSIGAYVDGSQTVNILSLFGGLVPEKFGEGVAKHLINDIVNIHDMHLTTGAIGTRYLMPVLTEIGRIDIALALANQTTFPSWGYWISKGATTLWEDWSGQADLTHPPAPTHDHIFLGSHGSWLYEGLAGIGQHTVGFDHLILRPPHTRLSTDTIMAICSNQKGASLLPLRQVTANHNGVHGKISYCWQENYNSSVAFYVSTTIPPNSVADVYIPVPTTCSQRIVYSPNSFKAVASATIVEREGTVWQDGKFIPGVDGVFAAEVDPDASAVVLKIGSGVYSFYLLN